MKIEPHQILSIHEGQERRQLIEEARRVLAPLEVHLHDPPTWLAKRLADWRRVNEMREGDKPSALFEETIYDICDGETAWLDHWGQSTGGPYVCCDARTCFVSEPYGFDTDAAHALDKLCDALGLEWHVCPNSWWFPGRTLRVTVHEKPALESPLTPTPPPERAA